MRLRIPAYFPTGRSNTGGFTLLEVIVTMSIVALMLGLAAFSLGELFRQQDFEKPVANLKLMARQAAGLASSRGRPHVIRFDESAAALFAGRSADPIDEFRWPSGVELFIQPWGGTNWRRPNDFEWAFEASGLCEPIRVRFEEGDSFFEVDFHPLGGGVRDERMMMANQVP